MTLAKLNGVINVINGTLTTPQKAQLAGHLLNAIGIDDTTFVAFWAELDDREREKLDIAMSGVFDRDPD